MRFGVSLRLLKAPWTQLTNLVSQGPSLDQFHEVLQGSPNLVECCLHVHRRSPRLDPARSTVQHAHLRILDVFA